MPNMYKNNGMVGKSRIERTKAETAPKKSHWRGGARPREPIFSSRLNRTVSTSLKARPGKWLGGNPNSRKNGTPGGRRRPQEAEGRSGDPHCGVDRRRRPRRHLPPPPQHGDPRPRRALVQAVAPRGLQPRPSPTLPLLARPSAAARLHHVGAGSAGLLLRGPDRLFIPAPSRNPHLNAAAADADFHCLDFADMNPRSGSVIDDWLLRAYDGGRLLLSYGFLEYEELAVYDPIARTADLVCRPDIMQFDFEFVAVHYALLVDEADASFRVVGAQFWPVGTASVLARARALENAWRHARRPVRVLAVQHQVGKVPFHAKESYCVADMAEHGGLCLVASKNQVVQIWVRDNDGGWVIKKQISLLKQFGLLKRLRHDEWMKRVRILAVRDGCVYMEFWSIRKPNSYLLVLNWETMKLSVIANDTDDKYRGPAFLFFMTWAPPLLSPAEQQRLRLEGDRFERNGNTCYVSK
ncbi:F-box domain containing protein, expressed [Panicum miliaceum]|uniref:F-box domain containing protein, expressed n=1 Tax=Panicum miliaceum TaxID=4540 RepID=A0A3L6QN96_PANMI|nr:F-box domain containing protein, expressed [Panicum miliaceum]